MSGSRGTLIGSVESLWRYPVKSMQGEELNAAEVTERGLLGDRAYALIDNKTGRVVSAKNPTSWARLLEFRAAFCEAPRVGEPIPPVRITLPDGTVLCSGKTDVHRMLSWALGRGVTLAAIPPRAPVFEESSTAPDGRVTEDVKKQPLAIGAPSGTFFDFAPTHLVTSAALRQLRELSPHSDFAPRRFRPNILIESTSDQSGFADNAWVGSTLAIAEDARIHVATPCPRCVMTTLRQGDLPQDATIFRTIALHNKALFVPLARSLPSMGVYGIVSKAGTIQRGDPVHAEKTPVLQSSAFWLSVAGNFLKRQLH